MGSLPSRSLPGAIMTCDRDQLYSADIAQALAAAENEGWPMPRPVIAVVSREPAASRLRRATVPKIEYRLRLVHDARSIPR